MKKAKLSQDYVHSDEEEHQSKEESISKDNGNTKDNNSKDSSCTKTNVFELSAKRRVTLRKFKSNILVDIREFYEDRVTGEDLPGKKGISLTLEQFLKLKELIPCIEAAMEEGNFE